MIPLGGFRLLSLRPVLNSSANGLFSVWSAGTVWMEPGAVGANRTLGEFIFHNTQMKETALGLVGAGSEARNPIF